jgi:hypothetical protein
MEALVSQYMSADTEDAHRSEIESGIAEQLNAGAPLLQLVRRRLAAAVTAARLRREEARRLKPSYLYLSCSLRSVRAARSPRCESP